jgi:hypothetical protein
MAELDRWQVSHLVLGDADPHTVVDVRNRTDRNRYLLLAPEVAFVDQDVVT